MKVIIIDNNVDRHAWHNDIWNSIDLDVSLSVVNGNTTGNILESGYNMVLIHGNNPELHDIEELEDCEFLRIFFSRGYTSIKTYPDEKLFYIPLKNLKDFLENTLIKIG